MQFVNLCVKLFKWGMFLLIVMFQEAKLKKSSGFTTKHLWRRSVTHSAPQNRIVTRCACEARPLKRLHRRWIICTSHGTMGAFLHPDLHPGKVRRLWRLCQLLFTIRLVNVRLPLATGQSILRTYSQSPSETWQWQHTAYMRHHKVVSPAVYFAHGVVFIL